LALLAVTVAGLYTQYYFGFLLAGEALFLFYAALSGGRWALLGRWVAATAAAALLFVPWLPFLQRQAFLPASNALWGYPEPAEAAQTVWAMTWVGFDPRLGPAALVACAPPVLLGIWALRRRPEALGLMVCLVLVPLALAIGSAVYFHSFRERGF